MGILNEGSLRRPSTRWRHKVKEDVLKIGRSGMTRMQKENFRQVIIDYNSKALFSFLCKCVSYVKIKCYITVKDELEVMWKDGVVAYFKVLFHH
jgi:hypothetical protein